MYSPAHYQEERAELIREVVGRYSFATIITVDGGEPFVSHLPLIFDRDQSLIGHCARANPQWRHFSRGHEVTAIFQGPHAYISPAWYEDQHDNVPTWNYVAVHVKGSARLIETADEAYGILQKVVRHFETFYATGWTLPAQPNVELSLLLKSIVAFRIDIKDVQAKFKLSQKQDPGERANVIEQLPKVLGSDGLAIAEYMKIVMN